MIHKFSQGGKNLVVDVNSGAVHVVDELVYRILDFYPQQSEEATIAALKDAYHPREVAEAIKEIQYLVENGLLFREERYQEHPSFQNKKPVVKALCLHIAHDCNIRCQYCFASQGDFKGNRSFMSFEVGKNAIDFLLENSGSRKNLEVDFFGGEPLMNFGVVKEIVAYGREKEKAFNKQIRFTMTTNGMLLNDDNMKFINEEMFNVVLSIDGRKETNDKMRYTINGQGTYETIVPKLLKMAEMRNHDNYYVRGTFTRNNLDFSKDVLHLTDLGFTRVSVEPVVASPEHDYAIRQEDLPTIFEHYEQLAEEYVKRHEAGKPFSFFHFMIDLHQGPCIIKRIVGCGAGAEYLAVTPEGELYPCHQFVGNEDFKIGNVNTKELDKSLYAGFADAHVFNKPKCEGCWAKFYCSGGCHANAYNFNQDIKKPYEIGCEMEKKRIESALMIQARLTKEEA